MSPAQAAARQTAATARSAWRGRAEPAPRSRPPLRVVHPRRDHRRVHARRQAAGRLVALLVVAVSLLMVVVAHALLAEGQIRLTRAESALAAAQNEHRQLLLSVAHAETPSRIVNEAKNQLHMVQPSQVDQLPSVPLNAPVTSPNVPAPPAGTSTSTPGSSSTTPGATSTTSGATSTTTSGGGPSSRSSSGK